MKQDAIPDVSPATMARIEGASGEGYRELTLRRLERALGWPALTIDRIRDGLLTGIGDVEIEVNTRGAPVAGEGDPTVVLAQAQELVDQVRRSTEIQLQAMRDSVDSKVTELQSSVGEITRLLADLIERVDRLPPPE